MVIEIKKRTLAIASGLLALFVILVIGVSSYPAQAVTLPQPNITVLRTVTLPPVVVTRLITIRPSTVTVKVPLPPRTRTVRLPGQIVTRVVTQPPKTVRVTVRENGQTVRSTAPSSRQTVSGRATIGPTPVTSTVQVTKLVTLPPKDAVVLTKIKAAGISLLLVLIGVLLAIALVWAAFTYGWVSGDNGNREFIKETLDDLRYDK